VRRHASQETLVLPHWPGPSERGSVSPDWLGTCDFRSKRLFNLASEGAEVKPTSGSSEAAEKCVPGFPRG
jgi:hypothetical protein